MDGAVPGAFRGQPPQGKDQDEKNTGKMISMLPLDTPMAKEAATRSRKNGNI
jgi:hypothetical protein